MTFADKCAKAAGYWNPAVAMAALHALAKEVKTYEEHHILAGLHGGNHHALSWGRGTIRRALGR